jgi:SAM-dependent methyltransferase
LVSMPMNLIHRRLCRSDKWISTVESQLLPWVLSGVDLGADVLEIGPGYGVTTRLLVHRAARLTAVEVDPDLAAALDTELGERARILHGDGAKLPLPECSFDAVVCFTMLHHMPSAGAQDRLFTEVARVLRPGGVFAGSDSRLSLRFRLLHIADTMVVVDPLTLPQRLQATGMVDAEVALAPRAIRFRARRPC